MTSQCRSRSSRLLLSSLLVSYIVGAILYSAEATATPSEPEISTSSLLTHEKSSSLIVCAVDGSIYTIDAITGTAKGYFGTGRPLVGSSSPAVVPGLDGSIYTLSKNQQIAKLPVTVQQCVQHPIQTCTGDECGVVTGTKHTFLYGLDPTTGRLEWTQQYGKTDPDDARTLNHPVVILHREDFVVRHISTATGEELWNVTLGHVSALDFNNMWGDDDASDDGPWLPGRVDEEKSRAEDRKSTLSLPSIAFGSEGTTMTAIDDQHQVLWRRQLNTVIASVYGVIGKDWAPLRVVDTAKEHLYEGDTAMVPLLPPSSRDLLLQQRDMYLKLLWNEIQRAGTSNAGASEMVIYQPPMVDTSSAELNRLAQKASHSPPTCSGQTIDGICYNTPLLESGSQKAQPAGIYLTWDRLFVTVVLLGLGIRVLMAHKKRAWTAERRNAVPTRRDLPEAVSPEDRTIERDRELSFSEDAFVPRRLIDFRRAARGGTFPDLTLAIRPEMELWKIEKADLHRSITAPNVTDTSTSSLAGHIDGIPFVKHSRYQSEFREIDRLGKGGFGTVFRCENALDGRQYAIKKVRIPSGEEFSQRLQRVLREVKTLARLDHPNIVRYYTAWLEAEEDDGKRDSGDIMEASNSMGRCYSVELMTSNSPSTSDGRRPPMSRDRRPPDNKTLDSVYNMTNPLGWNGIDLDGSFDDDKDLSLSQGSDFGGFYFDRTSGSLEEEESTEENSNGTTREEQSLARSPANSDATPMASNKRRFSIDLSSDSDMPSSKTESAKMPSLPTRNVRHTLYIQMHLCSQKTLADFLSNADARKGSGENPVDIPLALSLFHQIAEGVKHVHEQGLIHRDLKPSNCFIDDGVVKVGDFGLSRECSSSTASEEPKDNWLGGGGGDNGDDFSAGIGTRAYASPEQQNGSNYDSSTDVYSLGIMLFELCYPMCTGMERNIVFSRLRQREFPLEWQTNVATSFPIVHNLVTAMLSPRAQDRPSAETVASRVESLLGEYTVLYLDRKGHKDGSTLIRVEAVAHEGILPQTIQVIKEAAPDVEIAQYGLRGQGLKAIMEFALSSLNKDSLGRILSDLQSAPDVHVARQISDSVSMKL